MKVGTHYRMAKIALSRLNNAAAKDFHFGIRARLFCVGTVLPDLGINQLIHRHFYPLSAEYIKKRIRKLENNQRKGPLKALKAGAVAHYLADFCCAVHASGGIGNVKEHLHNERSIHRFVKEQIPSFSQGAAQLSAGDSLERGLFSRVQRYHHRQVFSHFADLDSSVEICEHLYGYLFKKDRAEEALPEFTFELQFSKVAFSAEQAYSAVPVETATSV